MKKEKFKDILVYYEKDKVAVTISKKVTEHKIENGCNVTYNSSYGRMHIIRLIPFFYRAHRCGELLVETAEKPSKICKGDTIKITKNGRVIKKKQKGEKRWFYLTKKD